jgi:glycogen synthase
VSNTRRRVGIGWCVWDHNWKLRRVVNGIDDIEWNPKLIPAFRVMVTATTPLKL